MIWKLKVSIIHYYFLFNKQRAIYSYISSVVASLITAPIGTITAWSNRASSDSSQFESLPDGWVLCDGRNIPEPSIWAGEKTPDLNGERRFLRGGDVSDLLKMEDHQLQDHEHSVDDSGHTHTYLWKTRGNHSGSGRSDNVHYDAGDDNDEVTSSSSTTGVTVGKVSSGNHGSETRPINMSVLYIMRVF